MKPHAVQLLIACTLPLASSFAPSATPKLAPKLKSFAATSVQHAPSLPTRRAASRLHAVNEDGQRLRDESERLMLQAERLKLQAEREALELAKAKLIAQQKKSVLKADDADIQDAVAALASDVQRVEQDLAAAIARQQGVTPAAAGTQAASEFAKRMQRDMVRARRERDSVKTRMQRYLKVADQKDLEVTVAVMGLMRSYVTLTDQLRDMQIALDALGVAPAAEDSVDVETVNPAETLRNMLMRRCFKNGLSKEQAQRAVQVFTQKMAEARQLAAVAPYSSIIEDSKKPTNILFVSEEGIAKALDAAAPDRAGLLVVHTFDLLMTAVNAGVKDAELWSETGVTLCSMLANMLIKNPGQAAEASHTACG
eukprot:16678-Heterococcus_DN1.PRE.1